MTRPRLTDADWQTIRQALNHAIEERESYADAVFNDPVHHKRAVNACKKFEALHVKMFGEPSSVAKQAAADAVAPTISLFDLVRRTE